MVFLAAAERLLWVKSGLSKTTTRVAGFGGIAATQTPGIEWLLTAISGRSDQFNSG